MASPRKTSTETSRGACAGRTEDFVLTLVTGRESAAVTMLKLCKHGSKCRSSVHVSGRESRGYLRDVKKLQLKSCGLFLEPVQQDSVPYARGIGRSRSLECHEARVGRDHRIRRLAALIVVEVRQPRKILSRPIEPQLPDVDIPGPPLSANLLALPIRFDCGVEPIRKDSFNFVISSLSFRKVCHLTRL